MPDVDIHDLERRLAEASRSWHDDFTAAVIAEYGEETGATLSRRYLDSFPEAYKEDFAPRTAAVDLGRLEAIEGDEGIDHSLYQDLDAASGEARLKVFRIGPPLSLSEILPTLSSMGVEVVDERPYVLDGLTRPSHIYEFGLHYDGSLPENGRELFQDAIRAVWDGYNEIDGFNGLVLGARLTWRQATLLRAYAKYLKQGNSPFALDYIEDALCSNTDITRLLVRLFEARFDPSGSTTGDDPGRTEQLVSLEERILLALDDVASLDHDRILRSYLTLIKATLRTNYFQPDSDGRPQALHLAEARALRDPGAARAPAPVRDLRLLTARRGRAPAVRRRRARWPALVRPPRRLPDRGPRPGQGADGQEHRDRAGGRQGRLLLQAAARPFGPRGLDERGHRLLQDVHLRPARHHRQPGRVRVGAAARRGPSRRRRHLSGGGRRQGHRDVLRHRQRRGDRLRLLARRRVRQRRLGRLRPQGDGHHRTRRVGGGAAALPRDGHRLPGRGLHLRRHRRHVRRRVRQRHALLRAHPAGRRLRPPRHLRRSRHRTPSRRTPSAGGCSRCPGRAGRTTTRR